MQIINLKINLSKIDKSKLFKSEKTGSIYLDATLLLNDQPDQYENHGFIVQDTTKEEREAGIKGAILGNARILEKKETVSAPVLKEDLPF